MKYEMYGVIIDDEIWGPYGDIDEAKEDVEECFRSEEEDLREHDVEIVSLHTVAKPSLTIGWQGV